MRYLVTGADGFIGQHFINYLTQHNIPVRAMVQNDSQQMNLPGKPEIITAELTLPDSLYPAVKDITHIIHLAARVHVMNETAENSYEEFHKINVEGTVNLLQAAANSGVTNFLLMSTVKAMGEANTGIFDESSPCNPSSPYGQSKLRAENALFDFAAKNNIHAVVLRLPMVYGPGNKGNMLRLLEASVNNRILPIGRINNKRSMVYVLNVVEATMAAISNKKSNKQVYLICDKRPYSTLELYTSICEALGKKARIINIPISILSLLGKIGNLTESILKKPMPVNSEIIERLTSDLYFNSSKIKTELGFEPTVELTEGIQATVNWYLNNYAPENNSQ